MGELFFEQGFGESWLGVVRILNRVWGVCIQLLDWSRTYGV